MAVSALFVFGIILSSLLYVSYSRFSRPLIGHRIAFLLIIPVATLFLFPVSVIYLLASVLSHSPVGDFFNSLPVILSSSILHLATAMLISGDFLHKSESAPFARCFSIIFTCVCAFVLLHERIPFTGFLGIFAILSGILLAGLSSNARKFPSLIMKPANEAASKGPSSILQRPSLSLSADSYAFTPSNRRRRLPSHIYLDVHDPQSDEMSMQDFMSMETPRVEAQAAKAGKRFTRQPTVHSIPEAAEDSVTANPPLPDADYYAEKFGVQIQVDEEYERENDRIMREIAEKKRRQQTGVADAVSGRVAAARDDNAEYFGESSVESLGEALTNAFSSLFSMFDVASAQQNNSLSLFSASPTVSPSIQPAKPTGTPKPVFHTGDSDDEQETPGKSPASASLRPAASAAVSSEVDLNAEEEFSLTDFIGKKEEQENQEDSDVNEEDSHGELVQSALTQENNSQSNTALDVNQSASEPTAAVVASVDQPIAAPVQPAQSVVQSAPQDELVEKSSVSGVNFIIPIPASVPIIEPKISAKESKATSKSSVTGDSAEESMTMGDFLCSEDDSGASEEDGEIQSLAESDDELNLVSEDEESDSEDERPKRRTLDRKPTPASKSKKGARKLPANPPLPPVPEPEAINYRAHEEEDEEENDEFPASRFQPSVAVIPSSNAGEEEEEEDELGSLPADSKPPSRARAGTRAFPFRNLSREQRMSLTQFDSSVLGANAREEDEDADEANEASEAPAELPGHSIPYSQSVRDYAEKTQNQAKLTPYQAFISTLQSVNWRFLVEFLGVSIGLGALYCTYSILDKAGVTLMNPLIYWQFVLIFQCSLLLPSLYWYYWPATQAAWNSEHRKTIVMSGFLFAYSSLILLFCFANAPVSYVVPVKEIAIGVWAIYCVFVLKEKLKREKSLGILAIGVGFLLIGVA